MGDYPVEHGTRLAYRSEHRFRVPVVVPVPYPVDGQSLGDDVPGHHGTAPADRCHLAFTSCGLNQEGRCRLGTARFNGLVGATSGG